MEEIIKERGEEGIASQREKRQKNQWIKPKKKIIT